MRLHASDDCVILLMDGGFQSIRTYRRRLPSIHNPFLPREGGGFPLQTIRDSRSEHWKGVLQSCNM